MISVVMPSYLGAYKTAAKNRDKKIVRAIQSVIHQTFKDWELIVVADGCQKTVDIVQPLAKGMNIKIYYIDKQKMWSGFVRNTGIHYAEGEYICYLDIDDAFAPDHLEGIAKNLKGKAWYWFDDYIWNGTEFRHRKCSVDKVGQCGTSNIAHKKIAWWNIKDNYAHDWNFINNLKAASKNYAYMKDAGKYLVCHVPGKMQI